MHGGRRRQPCATATRRAQVAGAMWQFGALLLSLMLRAQTTTSLMAKWRVKRVGGGSTAPGKAAAAGGSKHVRIVIFPCALVMPPITRRVTTNRTPCYSCAHSVSQSVLGSASAAEPALPRPPPLPPDPRRRWSWRRRCWNHSTTWWPGRGQVGVGAWILANYGRFWGTTATGADSRNTATVQLGCAQRQPRVPEQLAIAPCPSSQRRSAAHLFARQAVQIPQASHCFVGGPLHEVKAQRGGMLLLFQPACF